MEAMVPNVEKYWKTMASSVLKCGESDGRLLEKHDADNKSDDGLPEKHDAGESDDGLLEKHDADNKPDDGLLEKYDAGFQSVYGLLTNMSDSNPMMDYWKEWADKMPDFSEYWEAYTDLVPGWKNYWESFAKMMPNPEKFAELAPFKVPGFDAFTKVFDMWKNLGEPSTMVQDFQKKYMDTIGEVIKSLFPENVKPFIKKPMDYLNVMANYYKQLIAPWAELDADVMQRLAKGEPDAYIDFFKECAKKYEEEVEIFLDHGHGSEPRSK